MLFWKKEEQGEEERGREKEIENLTKTLRFSFSSSLTWVKHHLQMQRARRAARDILPHGELLLFLFFLGGEVGVERGVERLSFLKKIRKVRLLLTFLLFLHRLQRKTRQRGPSSRLFLRFYPLSEAWRLQILALCRGCVIDRARCRAFEGAVFVFFVLDEAALPLRRASRSTTNQRSSSFSLSLAAHLGDLEHVPARACKGEGAEFLIPLHVLDLDLVVGRHGAVKKKEAKERKAAAASKRAASSVVQRLLFSHASDRVLSVSRHTERATQTCDANVRAAKKGEPGRGGASCWEEGQANAISKAPKSVLGDERKTKE